jgi:outer membrane protein insertion porin family
MTLNRSIQSTYKLQARWPKSGHRIHFALMACLLLAPSVLLAQGGGAYHVASVSVLGSKRFAAVEAAQATGLKVGDSITTKSLDEAASKLASLGVFGTVSYRYQTRGDAITVTFNVEDAAQFLPCSFGNFIWFTPQELKDGIRARVPLFDGFTPPGGGMLDQISAALSAVLETRGIHAQVQGTPVGQAGGPIQSIQFQVIGVSMPVRTVEFTGLAKVDPAELQKAASPLINKDYDASFIHDFSRQGVAAVYRQRGYLRAEFGEPVPRLLAGDPTPNAVSVTIPVTEGEQYRLKELTWSGDSAIPYTELAKTFHATVGAPVNAVQLEQDALAMLMLFHPRGYLDADVNAKPSIDDANHLAAYEIQLRQGDQFHLGKLEIAGLDDSRARTFEQLSRLRPGDPYNAYYWDDYLKEVLRKLPAGWTVGNPVQTIHHETKTVDVRFNFHSTGSE